MTYIKRMVMHGFKSFARKTEIPLDNSMNVIVGPNGSGKSNVTDALCFVLGRLSIKSMRAAKAANLLFSGNKMYKGAREAYVEIVFDNSDSTFGLDTSEVHIKRIVRKNGNSIYKINNITKTRQELLELLAQAGIDPMGFNIVLQGNIGDLVKATAEERRKILEEVAGISIYETRKYKSLKELEKTEEKLKEASFALKQRSSTLKNLEKERQDALNKKRLEETLRRCKGTILSRQLKEKESEIRSAEEIIQINKSEIVNLKESIAKRKIDIEQIQAQIEELKKRTESSREQEEIYNELKDLEAKIAGERVRKENYERKILENQDKIINNKERLEILRKDLDEIKSSSPEIKEQQQKQRGLQEKLDELETKKRRYYYLKSEISTKTSQREEKEKYLIESKKELQLIEQSINSENSEMRYASSLDQANKMRGDVKKEIEDKKTKIKELESGITRHERAHAIYESNIQKEQKMKNEIIKLRNCPICKQEVDENHKHKISKESEENITHSSRKLKESDEIKEANRQKIEEIKNALEALERKLSDLNIDEMKIKNAENSKERIKKISLIQKETNDEIKKLNESIHKLRPEFESLKDIEERYDEARLGIQELSFVDLDVDSEIGLKQRDLGRIELEIKTSNRAIEEDRIEIGKIEGRISEQQKIIQRKNSEAEIIYKKNQKLNEEKTALSDSKIAYDTEVMGLEHKINNHNDRIADAKIRKAEYEAGAEAIAEEVESIGPIELMKDSLDKIKERLQNVQFRLSRLGEVNMKSVEAFDLVKEQVEKISEKIEKIREEGEKIKKIILEIDKKKKKTFLHTLNSVNEYFTRNFSQLSRKGKVSLELENKSDPFDGGLNIFVRVSRGKYFDVQSLSGGEKAIVALSLLFAIQEYKPYCFYIFDEIDAPLDKRNSELLAALIKKYMTTGQYIIITHNDTMISEATNLYGVSMQENISKIISLKV